MRRTAVGLGAALLMAGAVLAFLSPTSSAAQGSTVPEPGQLTMLDRQGRPSSLCPLKGTKVNAEIAGFGARVSLVQTFVNPTSTPIEAVYTFPLPPDAAVDRMRIKIGSRVIEGQIKRKEEARRIYEAAKSAGQSAALLDQERPNIFTQSVANIMPNVDVQVEISYVQVLKYEKGEFEFKYPMVVGPRFLGNASDPQKIAPPITPKGTRAGSNIELNVSIDAGAPLQRIGSGLHEVRISRRGDSRATVQLAKKDEIPNRDFVLRYGVATDAVQSSFVTCYDGAKGGFFSLILLPPKAPAERQIAPREMVFVMDQSGSQSGFPIGKSKELTLKLIKTLRPKDTFNVFGFNNTVRSLFREPQSVTPETLAAAEKFVNGMEANGGTQLLEGLKAALQPQKDPSRLRIVVFNTDGYVGDEPQILDTIVKTRDTTRIFTFGIGDSVNQYLIDAMSMEGKGDSETVYLNANADMAVSKFLQRTRTPVLTDVRATVEGCVITELTPEAIPDVFSERPIAIFGRYENPGHGRITVSGRVGGEPWSKTLDVNFSAERGTSCVSTLWARKKVDDLQRLSYVNMLSGRPMDRASTQITDLALEFGIMTQFTSFVAVEPTVINVGGKQYTVRVPVDMAHGVSYEMGSSVGEDKAMMPGRFRAMGGAALGGGGGGFSGRSAGAPAAVAPPVSLSVNMAKAVYSREQLSESPATKSRTKAEARRQRYEQVVAKKLRAANGRVAVMVWLSTTDARVLKVLREAGLKIEKVDNHHRVVFGTGEAKVLRALADISAVQRIEPLE